MIGDKYYKNTCDNTDIALGTKNTNPLKLLKRIYRKKKQSILLNGHLIIN